MNKDTDQSALGAQYHFKSIFLESLSPTNCEARKFLSDLRRTISHSSARLRSCLSVFLFYCFSLILFVIMTASYWT